MRLPARVCGSQDDSWQVISAHFKCKGLVRQQLVRGKEGPGNRGFPFEAFTHALEVFLQDSFNEFIQTTVQEIVGESLSALASPLFGLLASRVHELTPSTRFADETSTLEIKPNIQHIPGGPEPEEKSYQITFGQIYLSKTMSTEADGETVTLFPKEARLRNLT